MATGGNCEICGEYNEADTRFCTSCGAYLGWEGATGPPSQAPSAAPPRTRFGAPSGAPPASSGGLGPAVAAPAAATTPLPAAPPAPAPPPPAAAHTAQLAGADLDTDDAPGNWDASGTGDVACPRCRTANAVTRRFCSKCGEYLQERSAATAKLTRPIPPPWWKRWFVRGSADDRRARSAFRGTLSRRVRILRVIGIVVALVLALGLFRLIGHDPVATARRAVNDLRGALVTVNGTTATADPPTSAKPDSPAGAAVDSRLDTAWAITWTDNSTGASDLTCGPPTSAPALVVTAPETITLRAIQLRAGVTDQDPARLLQWRPHILELRFTDGACQRVSVKDTFDRQIVNLHKVTTNAVRITVVGAYAPQAPLTGAPVAITEINLLTRPD